jgi:SAM-dependent methyltransferase
MKKTPDEHADRFDNKAEEYDDSKSAEYRECRELVLEHAAPQSEDVVVDLGTGTGAIALPLAEDAAQVIGRDVSEGMLEQAKTKASERGIENVSFGVGTFREPELPADIDVDIVTSNFALHHLDDEEKRTAIDLVASLSPRRIVLGDVMFFGEPDPGEPFYSPEVDDPSTVGHLADAFTDAGFALTAVERVHEQVGVLVAERALGDEAIDADLDLDESSR